MEALLTVAVFVGLAFWVIYTVDRNIALNGLRRDLREYIDQAEEVVRVADDIHYKAVVFSLTKIYNDYFSKELDG